MVGEVISYQRLLFFISSTTSDCVPLCLLCHSTCQTPRHFRPLFLLKAILCVYSRTAFYLIFFILFSFSIYSHCPFQLVGGFMSFLWILAHYKVLGIFVIAINKFLSINEFLLSLVFAFGPSQCHFMCSFLSSYSVYSLSNNAILFNIFQNLLFSSHVILSPLMAWQPYSFYFFVYPPDHA